MFNTLNLRRRISVLRILATVVVINVAVPLHAACAQSTADTDSIEIAAARFAKVRHVGAGRISFEPRVRAGDSFRVGRSAAHIAEMAQALGGAPEAVGCDHKTASCRLNADMGLVFQTPRANGTTAQLTVEVYTRTGVGSETYILERTGRSWRVIKVAGGSAS
jgi:hypothetical protein